MSDSDNQITIDKLGSVSKDWLVEDFVRYYTAHKEDLDKIHARTLNVHVKIHDEEGNQYKILRRRGKTIIQRISLCDITAKRDMIAQISSLTAALERANTMLEQCQKELLELKNVKNSDMGDRDGEDSDNEIIASVQDKEAIKRFKV